jgi:hypothetical protein
MSLDVEVKKQLDLRLAAGTISVQEYRLLLEELNGGKVNGVSTPNLPKDFLDALESELSRAPKDASGPTSFSSPHVPWPPPPPPPPPPPDAAPENAVSSNGVAKNFASSFYAARPERVLSPENVARMQSIAARLRVRSYEGEVLFLGGPRTGKTVLLSCLAKRFQVPSPDGIRIGCASQRSMEFRDSIYAKLREGTWPAATQGDIAHLAMEFITPYFTTPLHLYDFPGEVYRRAFADFLASDKAAAALRQSVANSSVALLLVSARDVFQTGISSSSAWAACEYSRFLHSQRHKPRLAVVLTGANEFQRELHEIGGPLHAIEQRLPDLYHLYPKEDFMAMAVSAVGETTQNGHAIPQPSPNFPSHGLEELLNWVLVNHALGCVRFFKSRTIWERLKG